jgi:hypothetical protein
MSQLGVLLRFLAPMAALLLAAVWAPAPAAAGTTGTIAGTVTDAATRKPLKDIKITAVSPSQRASTVSDDKGFYILQNLTPDTYQLSYERSGYETALEGGVTVQQDQNVVVDRTVSQRLREIGRVTAASASALVKPQQGTDLYVVTGQQLEAASGGDNLHKTLYEYIQTVPGVTSNGFPAQPRIRGGQVTDLGYEFDGIPIQERITGFFTSNLSNVGIKNVEVYTGGLDAASASNGTGIINTVVKTGTRPGFRTLSFGFTGPDFNHYLTAEVGGATADNKFSYYAAFDGVNSQNQYNSGNVTYPNVLFGAFNGAGPVMTRDIVANFHVRPSQRDDIQLLLQNGLGIFDYNYLLTRSALKLVPCPGAVAGATSSGGVGGTAPNGQPCPAGLYFASVDPNAGNNWHHLSGIGKIQWNHIINDKSALSIRIAENFNQYIFAQPLTDPNVVGHAPARAACPPYPYAPGTPLQQVVVGTTPRECTLDIEDFYGDRRSNMYTGGIDYSNAPNANWSLKLGIGDEIDRNLQHYYNLNKFNADGTYPQNSTWSEFPTSVPYAYASASFNVGRFVLQPGLRYQMEHYGYPGGGRTEHALDNTFAGTYRIDGNDVLRFSYGTTSSFIGTSYVYRVGSTTYDPTKPGESFQPQINHSADLMLERNLGSGTSLRFGPWYNKTSNYYQQYTPQIGTNPDGSPKFSPTSELSNGGKKSALGFELGLNHVDNRRNGVSYFLSATYDNYWTTSLSQSGGAFVNIPLPANLVQRGVLVRNPDDPLLSAALTVDAHYGPWTLLPYVYYQVHGYYDIGHGLGTEITGPEQISGGYYKVNVSLLNRINKALTLGVRATNVTGNMHDGTPCLTTDGTGCYPFNGPLSGVNVTPNTFIYQPRTNEPRRFELFATLRG